MIENLPQGIISLWAGKADQIPKGWLLCNGQIQGVHATPDLRSRFVIGADNGQELTSGEATKIEIAEGGNHAHNIPATDHRPPGTAHPIGTTTTDKSGIHSHDVNFKTNVDLRPKWYALCFIMYVGL